jgi:alpha-galactosidase
MHRQLWLNDPDCLMLRSTHTDLSPAAARAWAETVAVSGGMALVSDDLALLDGAARRVFDDVVAIGRASDAEAAVHRPARCPDLLERPIPTPFETAGLRLRVDRAPGVLRASRTDVGDVTRRGRAAAPCARRATPSR